MRMLIILLLVAFWSVPATAAVTLSLTMSPAAISFPDQDPDLFPSTLQAGGPVRITIQTFGLKKTDQWTLTAVSRGNLLAGAAAIPISAVSWSVTKIAGEANDSFFPGTMSTASGGVVVARGFGKEGPGSQAIGDCTFSIVNSWTYATGSYNQVTDFTLTSP